MPQHDLVINNASGAAVRADLNDALAALGSTMKGPNAPPAPLAGMLWLDDDTPSATVWTLKLYDGADWLTIGTFNVSTNTFAPANALPLAGGTLTGQLLAPAGSASTPAYSFSGDPDTGIFNIGPNTIGAAMAGVKGIEFSPNNVILETFAGAASGQFFIRAGDASATNARVGLFITLNENSMPVADIRQNVATDGSGSVEFYATPPGSRTSDRRVLRATIPGSGPIALVGPVNVTSGGQTVTGDLEASGNLRFNSGYGSAAIAYGVRAWVNFNGTGTVAIRGSGGVTSITDNNVGDYTINLNFTMPDTNYSVVGSAGPDSVTVASGVVTSPTRTTTSARILISDNNTDQLVDCVRVDLHFVR